jgi:hypothetical protein
VGLLEDLGDESNFPKSKRAWCSVCEALKTLSPAEAKILVERLNNKSITHVSLSIVLKKNGFDISDSTIGRHRRGVCQGVAI